MALAGVFGDLVGIRVVFLLAGGVVFAGGVAAALLYRTAERLPVAERVDAGEVSRATERASVAS